MESLAYIHQLIAYTDPSPAPIVTLWQRFNGQKRPSSGWLKFLGLSVIIAAAISLSEAAQAATVRVTTSNSNLNVRVQPNTSLEPVASLTPGTLVEVADSNTPGWFVITAGNYRNSYIASEFTVPVGVGGDPIAPGATGKMRVKTDNGLGINVREAPNSSSQIKGGFDEAEIVSVTASDTPGWSRVTEGRFAGRFVNNSWLVSIGTGGNEPMRVAPAVTPPVETNQSTERDYVIKTTSGNGVHVRALPIETSQRIEGLAEGAKITARQSGTAGWLQITSGSVRGGYVRDSWAVTPVVDRPRVSNSFDSAEAGNYRVKTNSRVGVIVRSSPTIDSRNMGGLDEGAVVRAVPFNSEWLQLVSGENSGGYIARQWTTTTSGAIATMNPRTGNYFVNTNLSNLMVRSAPRNTADAIAGLSKGQRLSAVASGTSGWLRITEGPYAGGYISSTWVSPTSNVASF